MDPQITLFNNIFIKNGSHGTIYTFKNYFATVFSVFSFQFQQNKFYPNRPLHLQKVSQLLIPIFFISQSDYLGCKLGQTLITWAASWDKNGFGWLLLDHL